MTFKIITGFEDENNVDVDYIRVYIYNENQGLKNLFAQALKHNWICI